MEKSPLSYFWLRRDLRLEDNAGLHALLAHGDRVRLLFIFDTDILDKLQDADDARVEFIHARLQELDSRLRALGGALRVERGRPLEVFGRLVAEERPRAVFANHDYEPYARERDGKVGQWLQSQGIDFKTFKDQVIFEKDEVVKGDGKPYTVFTPYARQWRARFEARMAEAYPSAERLDGRLATEDIAPMPSLAELGFRPSGLRFHEPRTSEQHLRRYAETRDWPAQDGSSRLSLHLRFGTRSVRQAAREALGVSETFVNELIWREFYMAILWHFPHVAERAFKPAYDRIPWANDERLFEAWCQGRTGYPLVDAGMRELNATGHMHNRVRMVVASFLTKHLLIDWRWGEAYFARKLLDFDLAANNGGWQWAAGSGCDAAPYFRVFNPSLQAKKFDPQGVYIRRWVPEFDSLTYPRPIVEHEWARKRALETYKRALGGE